MTATNQAEQLKIRHAELEAIIHKENRRPSPDEVYIHTLKREKLRIRDQLIQPDTQ